MSPPKVMWFLLGCASLLLSVHSRRAPECLKSAMGFDYMGTVSHTKTGLPCQPWSSQVPHEHNYTSPKMFPDTRVEDASNHCRDPDGPYNWFGPWCFTNDPDVRYQYCDIPKCSNFPECRQTELGTEYRGHIDVTSSGRKCARWPSGEAEHNYCRNPDGRPEGLYCYVGTGNETESCSIPFCKPTMHCKRSYTGVEYSGPKSITKRGRMCQRWEDQHPHQHNHTDATRFPDKTLEDAENYCRNPDDSSEGPWCYTIDPEVRREACSVDDCKNCRISKTGREYSGSKRLSASGHPCKRWDRQAKYDVDLQDASRYPDVDVTAAADFCRNPDNSNGGPWCFISDTVRDTCNIPLCTDKSEDVTRPAMAKHVIHIGVDGLRPDCIKNAVGGAPTLMKKMAEEGTHTLTRARTCLNTFSAPGWSSSLCGVDNEASGIGSNSWLPPWRGYTHAITPVTGIDNVLPCIFNELKAQDPSIHTASFYNWKWFTVPSNYGYPGTVDYEMRMTETYPITDELLLGSLKKYLKELSKSVDKSYTFFYLGNVDGIGHGFSWCSYPYNIAVGQVDRQIGLILDTLDETGMANDTIIIINADHGGEGNDHGRHADSDLLVPMFIKGPGIKKNHTFQLDVSNVDIAPTVAYALGLKPNPYWIGKPMKDSFT